MYYCDCVEDTEEDDPGSSGASDAEIETDQTLKFYYSACQNSSSHKPTATPRSPQRTHLPAASVKYDVSRIDDNLYLGDCKIAQDAHEMKRLNIKYILNAAEEVCSFHSQDPHFTYYKLNLRDECAQTLPIDTIRDAHEFISNALEVGDGAVLVHCVAGRSRSPSIVISYLMNKKGMTLLEAYNHVQTARKTINPNIAFLKALILYDHHLTLARENVTMQQRKQCGTTSSTGCDYSFEDEEARQVALMRKIQTNIFEALCELCFPTFDKNLVKKTVEQHIVKVDSIIEISAIEKQLYAFYG